MSLARSTGIYVKNGRAAAVRIAGRAARPRLLEFNETVGPPGEALKEIAISLKANPARARLVLPASRCAVRKAKLPLTNMQQIAKTVRFQAERYLPGVNPDDVVVDFFVTEKSADFTEAILVFVPRDALERDLAALRENGVEPDGVTVDFAALFNLASASGALSGSGPEVVVDYSTGGICLMLSLDGRLKHVRNLPPDGDDVSAREAAERLASEIEYTLKVSGVNVGLQRALFTGPLPVKLDMDAMEGSLGCDSQTYNLEAHLKNEPEPQASAGLERYLPALGAAVEAAGKTAVSLNLLRETRPYRNPYEMARKPLLLAAVLLVLFLAASLLEAMRRNDSAQKYADLLKKESQEWFGKAMGTKARFSSRSFHKKLKSEAASGVKRRADGAAAWPSFLAFMRDLTEVMPADERTVVHTIVFKGNKATIRGDCDDVESYDALARVLDQSDCFKASTGFRKRSRRYQRGKKSISFLIELFPGSR